MYVHIVKNKSSKQSKQQQNNKRKNAQKRQSVSKGIDSIFGVHVKPRVPGTQKRKAVSSGVRLSKCSLKYALAISDPFHPGAKGACLPVYPSPPSQKVCGFNRFIMTIGTNGVGWVACTPTLCNDTVAAFYTTGTYTGGSVDIVGSANTLRTGVTYASFLNLPYTAAQCASQANSGGLAVTGRIVSFGLRITYTGTTMHESGAYFAHSNPLHENIVVIARTADLIGGIVGSDVCGTTREPCSIELYPVSPTETRYTASTQSSLTMDYTHPYSNAETQLNPSNDFAYAQPAGYNTGAPSGVILVTGVAGSTYLCEIITHVEYSGPTASAMCTPSDSDQHGFEVVSAAAQTLPSRRASNHSRKSIPALLAEGIKEVGAALKPLAVDALVKGAAAMLL